MVAAAQHFEQCSDDARRIPFTLPSGRLISERELQRYLRRSKQIFVSGKLVPKATENPESSSHAQSSSLIAQRDSHPRGIAQNTRPRAEHPACLRRLGLRRLQTAFLFGQGVVCPAVLMAPHALQRCETFLGALERCLRSSWEIGMWSVNDNGLLLPSPRHKLDPFWIYLPDFHHLFVDAARLHLFRDIHRARKIHLEALSALRIGLEVCFPMAVCQLFHTLRGITSLSPGYAKIAIKWCSILFGGTSDTYPGLRSLFCAIENIELDTLLPLVTQAWGVYARCVEALDDRLSQQATNAKIQKIKHDPSSTWERTADALASLLQELKSNPKVATYEILDCTQSLARVYCEGGKLQKALETVKKGFQNGYADQQCNVEDIEEWRVRTNQLLTIRANLYKRFGNFPSAIKEFKPLVEFLDERYNCTRTRIQFFGQQQMGDLEAAAAHVRAHDKVVDEIATSWFEDNCSDEIGDMPEGFEVEAREESPPVPICEKNSEADTVADIGGAWQKYVDGKPFHDNEVKKDGWEWRDGLESVGQQLLASTASDPHGDIVMNL